MEMTILLGVENLKWDNPKLMDSLKETNFNPAKRYAILLKLLWVNLMLLG
jgi:hypothetical protein